MMKKDIQNFVNNFHENATKENKICQKTIDNERELITIANFEILEKK